jgi:hypothetical protein
MSRWKDQFENHPIHETLDWLFTAISKRFDEVDEDEIIEKRRLIKVIENFRETLASSDPELISLPALDSLEHTLRQHQFATYIDGYEQTGSVQNLVNASDYLTNYLPSFVGQFQTLNPTEKQAKSSIKVLESLVDDATNSLILQKDKLIAELGDLSNEVNLLKDKASNLDNRIEKNSSDINASINEWQGQFSKAQDLRSTEFNSWRESFAKEQNNEIDSITEQYAEDLQNIRSTFKEELEQVLEDSREKYNTILELYELTAGDSVGAGYIKNANAEQSQADRWRIGSIVFISLAVIWMVFSFYSNKPEAKVAQKLNSVTQLTTETKKTSSKSEVEPEPALEVASEDNYQISTIYRLFLTFSISGVLLWGSAYTAQQSTKHRDNENKLRRFALEVKAFDPFTNSLEPDQRNELKKQLTEKLFGQDISSSREDRKVIDEHAYKVITDGISSVVSKLSK